MTIDIITFCTSVYLAFNSDEMGKKASSTVTLRVLTLLHRGILTR